MVALRDYENFCSLLGVYPDPRQWRRRPEEVLEDEALVGEFIEEQKRYQENNVKRISEDELENGIKWKLEGMERDSILSQKYQKKDKDKPLESMVSIAVTKKRPREANENLSALQLLKDNYPEEESDDE